MSDAATTENGALPAAERANAEEGCPPEDPLRTGSAPALVDEERHAPVPLRNARSESDRENETDLARRSTVELHQEVGRRLRLGRATTSAATESQDAIREPEPDSQQGVLQEDAAAQLTALRSALHPPSQPESAPEKPGLSQALNPYEYETCLDRPYVQKEIQWARQYKKPMITLYESEAHRPGHFDYDIARTKYKGTPFEFILEIDAIKYQRDKYLADAMLRNILDKVKHAPPSQPYQTDMPKNESGCWDFFLSHHQAGGGDQMKSLLFAEQGKSSWYDNCMLDKSKEAMEEGVRGSKYFVLMLTGVKKLPEPQGCAPPQSRLHRPDGITFERFLLLDDQVMRIWCKQEATRRGIAMHSNVSTTQEMALQRAYGKQMIKALLVAQAAAPIARERRSFTVIDEKAGYFEQRHLVFEEYDKRRQPRDCLAYEELLGFVEDHYFSEYMPGGDQLIGKIR
eukprot:COSAG02_NODE_11014_length_1811_cov_1.789720_1_plen_456_part_01